MPLLDHFRPPLGSERSWDGFLAQWAAEITGALNGGLLPKEFFAQFHIQIGHLEVEEATFEHDAAPAWSPPAAVATLEVPFADEIEVQVFGTGRGGRDLVAAIELVSPGNKDRPATRRGFAAKCATYLERGMA